MAEGSSAPNLEDITVERDDAANTAALNHHKLSEDTVNKLLDNNLSWEFVNYHTSFPQNMPDETKAKALIKGFYPESFREYDALSALQDETYFKLIEKDNTNRFLIAQTAYPSYLSQENKAKMMLLGYSPKQVKALDYISEKNLYTDSVKNEEMMKIIELNHYWVHRAHNTKPKDMKIHSILNPEQSARYREKLNRMANHRVKCK